MAVINEKFQERIFGAEEGSAAKTDRAKLERHRDIAAKMFNTPVLSRKEMAFPAIADFASALLRGLNVYRTLYFVNVLKIDMVYVTAILTLIGIYDVMNNPLMGIVYDRTRTRWGKARPYLIFTPVPYFATTAILYCGALFLTSDRTDDPKKIIFVFLMLFLQETFSTIYSIPRDNMTSLMSPNPQDRITLGLVTSYASYFASQSIYGLFMPLQDLNRWGVTNISMETIFAIFGIATCFFGVLGNVALGVGCRERIILQPKPAPLQRLFSTYSKTSMHCETSSQTSPQTGGAAAVIRGMLSPSLKSSAAPSGASFSTCPTTYSTPPALHSSPASRNGSKATTKRPSSCSGSGICLRVSVNSHRAIS